MIRPGGAGWERAAARSWAAAMARSLDDSIGITSDMGNHASVSAIRSALVFHTHTPAVYVMMRSRADVPRLVAMGRPGPSYLTFDVCEHASVGRRKRSRLILNAPWSWAYADMLGFRWEARMILREMTAWGSSLSQMTILKLGSVPHRIATKWGFPCAGHAFGYVTSMGACEGKLKFHDFLL